MKKSLFALMLALTATSCKDGSEPLVPSAIQIVAGDGQSVAAGTAAIPPSVKVVTSSGKGVPGVSVTFVPAADGGVLVGGSQITDASGVATVTSWKVGTKAGTSSLTVSATGLSAATITASIRAAAPANVVISAGDSQTGVVGSALSIQPSVKVTDGYENPIAGVDVAFSALNGGTIDKASATTDANGVASAGVWRLGNTSGVQSLRATATSGSFSSQVGFLALANAEPATKLVVTTQPSTINGTGARLSVQPVLELRDRFDNLATTTTIPVTAAVAAGTGTLGGTKTVTPANGRVTFTDLTYTGTGTVQLSFSAGPLAAATSSAFTVAAASQCQGTALPLSFTLGQMNRYITNSSSLPACLEFSSARAGEQYLVMFENMSYSNGVFPGAPQDDGSFSLSLTTGLTSGSVVASARSASAVQQDLEDGWTFNGVTLKEGHPAEPVGGAQPAYVKRGGKLLNTVSSSVVPVVGDTIVVRLVGIARMSGIDPLNGIAYSADGNRKAVVRFVNSDMVIAEDARITSDPIFVRGSGGRNTPLTQADMQAIADEYALYAKPQANPVFNSQFNSAMTADPGRPIAVHTLMYSDNVWGYTYANTNYFAWDYWVLSDGSNKRIYQHAQRNADDLFMHEIAHTRHYGLLERAARTGAFARTWMIEGFARFSERLPIAARLLGSPNPSRTGNAILPRNPAFISPIDGCPTNPCAFLDDIPTYWYASESMYNGYASSSYIFDYFIDQVAKSGGDWVTALQEFLSNGNSQSAMDGIISKYLPGIDFGTLYSRSRLALYLDDIGLPGLPDWTQYHMYQLRASRSTTSSLGNQDPRILWPRIAPGATYTDARNIAGGGAFGYLIDGTGATADMRLTISPTKQANGVMTVVRIK